MIDLQKIVKDIPHNPGVYLMKDPKDRVIYIGKAKDLKDRIGTYFHESYAQSDPKLKVMINQTANVDYIITDSEIEALMLESRLIKDIKPKFNVVQKDDKSFGMLCITDYDDFPKIWFVRETDEVEGEKLGPFIGAMDLRRSMKLLQKIFKFATCRLKIKADDPNLRFFRPCLLYYIDHCSAPCAGFISKDRYEADINSLRRFLTGEKKGLITDLTRDMEQAANDLDFEKAAQLRDQIKALENLSVQLEAQTVDQVDLTPLEPAEALRDLSRLLKLDRIPRAIEGCDIANIQGKEAVGSIVSFVDGVTNKDGYRRFRIKLVEGIDDYQMIKEVIERRFARLLKEKQPLPDIFLVDGGVGHLNVAADVLKKLGIKDVILLSLAKKKETLYMYPLKKSIRPARRSRGAGGAKKSSYGLRLLMLVRDEAHRFAQHYHHILRRKATVGR